ncbi:MAG: hypothetical protein ABI899_03210 [Actinomycetota bacterium]
MWRKPEPGGAQAAEPSAAETFLVDVVVVPALEDESEDFEEDESEDLEGDEDEDSEAALPESLEDEEPFPEPELEPEREPRRESLRESLL